MSEFHLEVHDAQVVHSVATAVGENELVHVAGLYIQFIGQAPFNADGGAVLPEAGLAAPVGISKIDKRFQTENEAHASILADRLRVLCEKAQHNTSIVADTD